MLDHPCKLLSNMYSSGDTVGLGSLPRSYNTHVTALEAHVDNVKLTFVQQALAHEEQKINDKFGDPSSASSTDQTTLVGARKRDRSRKPRCFGCGELYRTLSS